MVAGVTNCGVEKVPAPGLPESDDEPEIAEAWRGTHGREWTNADLDRLYQALFEDLGANGTLRQIPFGLLNGRHRSHGGFERGIHNIFRRHFL